MGDISVKITEIDNISTVPVDISKVDKIAPVAVHIKELNQVDPLSIESLRVDRVAQVDPLAIDRLNVTRLPVVNISVNRVPQISIDVKRVPPVPIALTQSFDLPSSYTARARFMGFEVLHVHLNGCTRLVPSDCERREQARVHERSFPEVAFGGSPGIPSRLEPLRSASVGSLKWGSPRFAYAIRRRCRG